MSGTVTGFILNKSWKNGVSTLAIILNIIATTPPSIASIIWHSLLSCFNVRICGWFGAQRKTSPTTCVCYIFIVSNVCILLTTINMVRRRFKTTIKINGDAKYNFKSKPKEILLTEIGYALSGKKVYTKQKKTRTTDTTMA